MKKFVTLITIVVLILANSVLINHASVPVKVFLDGTLMEFDQPPVIINSRTMVPFRALFEAFGAQVSWNGYERIVEGNLKDTKIQLVIGDSIALVNDRPVVLDSPPIIMNNRTPIPIKKPVRVSVKSSLVNSTISFCNVCSRYPCCWY